MTVKGRKRALFLTGTFAYFFAYICRLDMTAAMPDVISSGSLTAEELGLITSVYFVCYGIGQLFGGFMSDCLDPSLLLAAGLGGSAVCNAEVFFFPSFAPTAVLWALNGLFQALIWAPILKLFTEYYTHEEQLKNLTNVSVAMPTGTLAGYAVSAAVLKFLSWKYVFLVCGILNAAVTVAVFFSVRLLRRGLERADEGKRASVKEMKTAAKSIFGSAFAAVLIPVAAHGALKDGVTSWTPAFLQGTFGTDTTFTLVLTMLVAVFNMFGAYLSRGVYKKSGNAYLTAEIFFLLALFSLVLFAIFGRANAALSVAFIVVITTAMYAANFIFISVLPLGFEKNGCVGTASGILNSVAYIGAALSCFCLGGMLEKTGWTGVVLLWLALGVVSVAVLALLCLSSRRGVGKNNGNKTI